MFIHVTTFRTLPSVRDRINREDIYSEAAIKRFLVYTYRLKGFQSLRTIFANLPNSHSIIAFLTLCVYCATCIYVPTTLSFHDRLCAIKPKFLYAQKCMQMPL